MKKKSIAVKTLESQLEYIEASIDNLRNQVMNLNCQIAALMDVRDNLQMNIECHMQESAK